MTEEATLRSKTILIRGSHPCKIKQLRIIPIDLEYVHCFRIIIIEQKKNNTTDRPHNNNIIYHDIYIYIYIYIERERERELAREKRISEE